MFSYVFFLLFVTLVNFGSSDNLLENAFAVIRNKPTFVDKTPMIYEFFKHKYLFINAPSKFGKSTNLDMINLFLSNHRPKQTVENFFIWTKIWENQEFVKEHIGQYPVIHYKLNFKGYSADYEQTLTSFKVSLYNAFIDHMYLLENENLGEEKLKQLKIYTDLTKIKLMGIDTFARGLRFLAEVLHQHHGKQVILLADEFGRGITEGILQNNIDLSSTVELYSSILNSTFYDESIISHALLTGENWLYGLKGPAVSLLNRVTFMQQVEFSRFYGFTYDEAEHQLTKANISKEEKSEVFKWYCGYSTFDGLFKVCNPYSLVKYLSHRKCEVYWRGFSSATDLIRRMVEVDSLREHITSLVMKNTVDMDVEKDTTIVEVEYLRLKVEETPQYCENFFLQILVETGYLTFAENQGQSSKIALKLPNEEVHSAVIEYTV